MNPIRAFCVFPAWAWLFFLPGCAGSSRPEAPRPVRVFRVARPPAPGADFTGLVRPARELSLAFPIGGTVGEVNARVGDRVEPGEVLARLEDYAGALEVRGLAGRLERLRSVRGSPEETAGLESRLAAARSRLERGFLRAPFPASVTACALRPGDPAVPGAAAISLSGTEAPELAVSVSEGSWPGEGNLGEIEVVFPELPGRVYRGEVSGPGPPPSPSSGKRFLVIALPGAGPEVRPGMFGRVDISGIVRARPAEVPDGAVLLDAAGSGHYAWVVREGKAVRREVRLGNLTSLGVEVISGLGEGDLVIVSGRSRLREGEPVRPVGEVLEFRGGGGSGSPGPPE
jgi:multidrug efflux pump subunit AcrA (membrane-fusion protein)